VTFLQQNKNHTAVEKEIQFSNSALKTATKEKKSLGFFIVED